MATRVTVHSEEGYWDAMSEVQKDVPIAGIMHKHTGATIEGWFQYQYIRRYVKGDRSAIQDWINATADACEADPGWAHAVEKLRKSTGSAQKGAKAYVAQKLRTIDSVRKKGWQSPKQPIKIQKTRDGLVLRNGQHRVMTLFALGHETIPEAEILCEL